MAFAGQGMRWKNLPKNNLGMIFVKLFNNFYFFVEDELVELEIGEDVAIIFKDTNYLEDSENRQTFKEALQGIERNNLATKFEIYLAAGK